LQKYFQIYFLSSNRY